MPIEGVKHFEAKFDVHLLLDVGTLHDSEVFVEARENSHVENARGVAKGEGCRLLERFDVKVEIRRGIEAAGVELGIDAREPCWEGSES